MILLTACTPKLWIIGVVLVLFTRYFWNLDTVHVLLMWSVHVLKNLFHLLLCFFFFLFQGGTRLEFFTPQGLGFSEGFQHWREQLCHIRRGGTAVFNGRLTKALCPWCHFIIWLLCSPKKAETTYLHIEKHSWDLSLWPRHMASQLFSVLKENIIAPARWKQALFSPHFFCGKDELKPKLIYLKNLGRKQNRFFRSHSFSPIGMLFEGLLQRKLLLEWKTLNETHVMWDFNSLELRKVKESGPYTLGLFSLVTKNVYAIGFSYFIRNPLHLFDRVNTNQLKLILKALLL